MATKPIITGFILYICTLLISGCQTGNALLKANDKDGPNLMEIRADAMKAYQQRDYKTALPLYQQLTTKVTSDAELWFHLGNIYARLQQPVPAIDAYQKAMKLNPKNAKAWHNMGIVQLRQSANTFTQMLENVPPNDPVYQRSEHITQGLLELLGRKSSSGTQESGTGQ
ncbi:MAG: tetratricopeptide repeat protein [Gammaproteobacteria bacterium]|nr:tetratricopeptide repeat protein [Gammaproteobacteria bacterium]